MRDLKIAGIGSADRLSGTGSAATEPAAGRRRHSLSSFPSLRGRHRDHRFPQIALGAGGELSHAQAPDGVAGQGHARPTPAVEVRPVALEGKTQVGEAVTPARPRQNPAAFRENMQYELGRGVGRTACVLDEGNRARVGQVDIKGVPAKA